MNELLLAMGTDGQQNISINTRRDKNAIITKLDLSFAGVSYEITSSPFSPGPNDDEDTAEENEYDSSGYDEVHNKRSTPNRREQCETENLHTESEQEQERETKKSLELERIERERAREERLKKELMQCERDGLMPVGGLARPHHPLLQHKGDSSRFSLRNLFTPRSNSKRNSNISTSSPALAPLPVSQHSGLHANLSASNEGRGLRGDLSESTKARRDRDREWEKSIDRERERRQREREKLRERERAAALTTRRVMAQTDK